jgi:hypothetical protein
MVESRDQITYYNQFLLPLRVLKTELLFSAIPFLWDSLQNCQCRCRRLCLKQFYFWKCYPLFRGSLFPFRFLVRWLARNQKFLCCFVKSIRNIWGCCLIVVVIFRLASCRAEFGRTMDGRNCFDFFLPANTDVWGDRFGVTIFGSRRIYR